MVALIKPNQFYGASKVFTGEADGLTKVVRGLAQDNARAVLKGITKLTDNSAGVASLTTVVAVPVFPAFTSAGADSVALADIEAAFGTVQAAISDLTGYLVTLNGLIPVHSAITNNVGVAASDTIAAVTKTFAAASAALASNAGANTVLATYLSALDQVTRMTNAFAVAAGAAPLVNALGVADDFSTTVPALVTAVAASTGAADAIAATAGDATFTALADNIATLAGKLNSLSAAAPLNVVAFNGFY